MEDLQKREPGRDTPDPGTEHKSPPPGSGEPAGRTSVKRSASGICTVATTAGDPSVAASDIAEALSDGNYRDLVLFFTPDCDATELCTTLSGALPDTAINGCSTSGEISELGMTEGGILAIAFPSQGFRILSEHIGPVHGSSVEGAREAVRRLMARRAATGTDSQSPGDAFALLLVDGLCNNEEMIIAAINWELEDIQLIGGSAGDGLRFDETQLIHRGAVFKEGAVLLIIETDLPFQIFKTQNFDPTETKLVVTKADPEQRIVYELNAEPAALEYAEAIGLVAEDLGPFTFASYPLVVRVGGEYYGRSIRNMNPDKSLTFFCAIDEGLVFTVANPVDMVWSTRETLEAVEQSLGKIDMVIGFDCILRRLDSENRQARKRLEDLYRAKGVVGFQTYGEQFNAMHLNQTLTGVAFGAPRQVKGGSRAERSGQEDR